MSWHAVQLVWRCLRFCNGMLGACALTSALPLGAPRADRAALGAQTTLLGARPGSAGARGGFLSLTWETSKTLRSASVSSALQRHVSQQLHPGETAEHGTASFFCQLCQIIPSISLMRSAQVRRTPQAVLDTSEGVCTATSAMTRISGKGVTTTALSRVHRSGWCNFILWAQTEHRSSTLPAAHIVTVGVSRLRMSYCSSSYFMGMTLGSLCACYWANGLALVEQHSPYSRTV